jgi:hypothetical protein
MRRTDFCHLTFFVRAPAPRRLSMRQALARLRDRGDRLFHVQDDSLRWVARSAFRQPSRWALSSRRDACEPNLWHPCRVPHGGHAARAGMSLPEGSRDHPPRTRVNEVRCRNDPRCLPSSKDRRPATPFRASGFGLRLHRDLAAALLTIDAFSPPPALSSRREPGSRPRAPLPAGGALL